MRMPGWFTIAVICEVAVLVFTFLSNIRRLLGPDPKAFYLLISGNLALVVILIGAKLGLLEEGLGKSVKKLSESIQGLRRATATIEALVDHDFYARFGVRLRSATVGVGLAHLDTMPPNRPRKTQAAEYYSTLSKTIKSSPCVRFRRVERASPEKIPWIKQLVSEYRSVENFSLGVLLVNDRHRHTGLLSVQVVDETEAVLVAVVEHNSSSGARDLWISDQQCTRLWNAYYENVLWRPAAKVIEDGVVNEKELERVISIIEAQCQSS